MKNKKKMVARVLACILLMATTVMAVAGMAGMERVLRYVSWEEAWEQTPLLNSTYMTYSMISAWEQQVSSKLPQSTFLKDDQYVENETVDITKIEDGIYAQNKNPQTTYSLKDLVKLYESDAYKKLSLLYEHALNETLTSFLQQEYSFIFFYRDTEGNLYGSRSDMPLDHTEELLEYSEVEDERTKNIKSETLYYIEVAKKASKVGTDTGIKTQLRVRPFYHRADTETALFAVNGTELDMRMIEAYYEQEISGQVYDVYGPSFVYLYENGRPCEIVLPQAQTLLADYALANPQTVSIYDTYKELLKAASEAGRVAEYGKEVEQFDENANVFCFYQDMETQRVITNYPDWRNMQLMDDEVIQSFEKQGLIFMACEYDNYQLHWKENQSNWSNEAKEIFQQHLYNSQEMKHPFRLLVWYNPQGREYIEFMRKQTQYEADSKYFEDYVVMCVAGIVLTMIGVLFLVVTTTNKPGKYVQKMPIEVLLFIDFCLAGVACALLVEIPYQRIRLEDAEAWYWMTWIFVAELCGLLALLSLTAKLKSADWKTNSLIGWGMKFLRRIWKQIVEIYNHRKETGKFLIIYLCAGVCLLFPTVLIADYYDEEGIFCIWILFFVDVLWNMQKAMQRNRINEAIETIAKGDLYYKMDISKFKGQELKNAQYLSGIQDGMSNALEEMVKSERLKADLITNVSHDIKTPLTSIINYVDILKRKEIEDEEIRNYIDILDQKSARLKQLTEDLVEASKISSGNVHIDMQELDIRQLIKQMNGEFAEKFENKQLEMVCTLPEEPVLLLADGRHMCRILENLYNNAAKYALAHTRVYVEVDKQTKNANEKSTVQITIKNVSECPLNFKADELVERFVRGDVSRNTEGTGLGLEIARNLTLLQNGTFDIYVDGDLFKVILTF